MKLICTWLAVGLLASGLLGAGLVLTGCSSSAIDPSFFDNPAPPAMDGSPSSQNGGNAEGARFHIGDTVIVNLAGPADVEIPVHQEPIKEDGTITLPDIGKVQAAGKTAGELQNELHDLYVPKYYTHLTVTVNIGDRVYYVSGEVKQPGRQLYVGETTVTKAITSAGDFTDFANHKTVVLTRTNGQRLNINVDRVRSGKVEDPAVYPGDQIFVNRRIW
jgi:polysaccharide export outer membrane protein